MAKSIMELCRTIAKKEGKKSEVKFGDIKEIVAIIADEIAEDDNTQWILVQYARKRYRKKVLDKAKKSR